MQDGDGTVLLGPLRGGGHTLLHLGQKVAVRFPRHILVAANKALDITADKSGAVSVAVEGYVRS